MRIKEKLDALRTCMKAHDVNAVIIPSNDAHQSEYVPDHYKSREWISGFTGSAGTIVVTLEEAGLWTDGRYYTQGRAELEDSTIVLHEMDKKPGPQYVRWLTTKLKEGDTVVIDGNICAVSTKNAIEKYLKPYHINLETNMDLIEEVWTDRARLPADEIFVHDSKYAGKTRLEKLESIREVMRQKLADHHLVVTLDDIAWIFNLRGSDVAFNPVFLSHAIISQDGATLYVHPDKVPINVREELESDGIGIKDYHEVIADLNALPEEETILIDNNTCTVTLNRAINAKTVTGNTISREMKAIKNATEIGYEREVMAKDCRALAKTFYWLEQQMKVGEPVTEFELGEKLAENRSQEELYIGESFNPIIGYKGNGAIIHYRAEEGNCATIRPEGVLLCDSGGQYQDGTTDITRTFAMGTPTAEEKRNFTLVLKGMIALTEAKFPEGTTGSQLDTLARQYLWEEGLDYKHGTGHGVGFFLNVHEPPQGFAPNNSERASTAHKIGMISSNEPGYYKVDGYGIRIENLLVVQQDKIEGFLSLETLTLYPIDIKMIDERLMSGKERAWLNNYHHYIYEKVGPMLDGEIKDWFELKCRPMN